MLYARVDRVSRVTTVEIAPAWATIRLGIDALIANILVIILTQYFRRPLKDGSTILSLFLKGI